MSEGALIGSLHHVHETHSSRLPTANGLSAHTHTRTRTHTKQFFFFLEYNGSGIACLAIGLYHSIPSHKVISRANETKISSATCNLYLSHLVKKKTDSLKMLDSKCRNTYAEESPSCKPIRRGYLFKWVKCRPPFNMWTVKTWTCCSGTFFLFW